MANHNSTPTHPMARKEHRCIYCGGPIVVGEVHVQQTGRRYHAECDDACADDCDYYGEWEFSPYSAEYPERVKAIVDARRAAAEQPKRPAPATAPALPA